MSESTSTRRRGQPQRHSIDVLFGQLWFFFVKARLGLPSATAIEQELEPHLIRWDDGVPRSSKWYSYPPGKRVPRRWPETVGSIEVAEQHVPGSAAVLESSLRPLLRSDSVTLHWIDDQLRSLARPIAELLFERQPSSLDRARLCAFDQSRAARLVEEGGLDALAAAVLLMRRAELTAYPELRRRAQSAYLEIQPALAAAPEFSVMADKLFAAIDAKFPHWVYLGSDHRIEMVANTNAMRRALDAVTNQKALARGVRMMLGLDRQAVEHHLLVSRDALF